MTISSTTTKVSYSGTGSQTAFAYTFKIFADSEMQVIIRSSTGTETTKTLTTHYTVSGAGADAGGTVTFTAGNIPASGETVVLRRNLALTQGTDYVENDPFPAESHEDGLDRLTMITQGLQEESDRSIKAPVTDPTSVDMTLPIKGSRATKVLAFDSAGDPVVSTQTLATMEAGSTAAASSATAAATSATAAASSATGAASSATGAASSATAAASSATGAAASAAAAAAAITGLPDGSAGSPSVAFADDSNTGLFSPAADSIAVTTGGSERMQIDSSGNVGIGTTPDSGVQLDVGGTGVLQLVNTDTVQLIASNGGSTLKNVSNNPLLIGTNNTERMRINSSGNVGIGTTAPGEKLEVTGAINFTGGATSNAASNGKLTFESGGVYIQSRGADTSTRGKITLYQAASDGSLGMATLALAADGTTAVTPTSASAAQGLGVYGSGMANGSNMVFISMGSNTGNFISGNNSSGQQFAITHAGALSKTSGSFKIDHPLPAKKDTHHLVHSFIEGPQADLIYRGRADLVAGTVDVNIDTAAGMTDGTFEVLCGDVQCFTSNEDGWTALRGSVTGNVLTITAQDDTCTDTVSWLVIGERCDPHMLETDWTDAAGKVIVEPLKTQLIETN